MAKKNRVDLNAVIQANLPDNNTDFITPALDREVEIDEVDSCFNLEDDTAFDVNYAPTTPADWGGTLPTEVGDGLDVLAARIGTNLSQDIAYVSNVTTAGIVPELGNPLKPFATIREAWEGTPTNNAIIKVLGGTYTEANLDFTAFAKTNFVLDLSSITLNVTDSNGLRPRGSQNGTIILHGATLNCPLSMGAANASEISVYGGTINSYINLGEKSYLQGVNINSTIFAIQSEVQDINNRPYLSNCRIVSSSSSFAALFQVNATFSNCFIQGVNIAYQPFSNDTRYSKFISCTLKTTGASSATVFGANAVLNGIFKQCRIQSEGGACIEIGGASDNSSNAFFEDCEIIASTNCVNVNNNLVRASPTRTTFKRCSFYTNTGEIVTGTPNGSDLGKTSLIGTTLTNKALLVGLTNFEVLGDQLTVTDAQIPPL
jgi:hypothetical protein